MALAELNLPIAADPLPHEVRAFLREADRRIERFRLNSSFPAFVPSDYARVYAALRTLAEGDVAPGNLFCEWGSGVGVVACLAAMLDFEACGIEIEGELVDTARELADDFGLAVEFVRGSFLPAGSRAPVEPAGFNWLATEDADVEEELGLGPGDFDVIFAYPWPDEERVIASLFDRHAAPGAVLVSYHSGDDVRLRRKTRRRGAGR